jgi:acyl-CoA reductase-like NAD-dependent aldehyde dehydrogenase
MRTWIELPPQIVTGATYNSGQDCAAPKCVLLHRDIAAKLAVKLTLRLEALKLGDTLSGETDVGPVTRYRSVTDFIDLVDHCRSEVEFGGQVDVVRRLVQPTLIIRRLDSRFHYPEVYAPVVNAAVFDHEQQVVDFTASDRYQRNAMYVSVFGTFSRPLSNTIVLQGLTVLEHEDGNSPFGGYGREASFVKVGGSRPVRGPVLVSAALAYGQEGVRR